MLLFLVRSAVVLALLSVPLRAQQGVVQEAYIKAASHSPGEYFGYSVAIDGDTAVIGAFKASTGFFQSGSAYVFAKSAGGWVQQAVLQQAFGGQADEFGRAVSISGDTIVIGAAGESGGSAGVDGNEMDNSLPGSGAAYVFRKVGGIWMQEAYLKASNPGSGDVFGISVSIDGSTICVGALDEASSATGVNGNQLDNSVIASGAAYVFQRAGKVWSQQAYLKASNTESVDFFGDSTAVAGDVIVVGAPREDSLATGVNGNQADNSAASSGAAYAFHRMGTVWTAGDYIKASNTGAADQFGVSLALDDDALVVGASEEESLAIGVGGNQLDNSGHAVRAAYILRLGAGTWTHESYLKPFSFAAGANHDFSEFGTGVDIEGDRVVVGGHRSNLMYVGVNGAISDAYSSPFEFYGGSAFVFERTASQWGAAASLASSNPESDGSFVFLPGDQFGRSVGLLGDSIFVGVPGEDSAAVGIDGGFATGVSNESGAAYAFDLGATCGIFRYGDYIGAQAIDLYARTRPVAGASFNLEVNFAVSR